VPEQIWDRSDVACFALGRPTGSACPLNWAEGQYLRLAQSIDAGYVLDTPTVVKAKYQETSREALAERRRIRGLLRECRDLIEVLHHAGDVTR
jgi:hypothetical protein